MEPYTQQKIQEQSKVFGVSEELFKEWLIVNDSLADFMTKSFQGVQIKNNVIQYKSFYISVHFIDGIFLEIRFYQNDEKLATFKWYRADKSAICSYLFNKLN